MADRQRDRGRASLGLPNPTFEWRLGASLTPTFGAGTFTVTRATSVATRINAAMQYEIIAANLPRFSRGPDGVMRLLVEPASTNDCLQSENFGVTWAAVGTPTRSAGAKTCGTLSLDLIGDDAAGTLEGYTQNIGTIPGGNAIRPFSFHIAKGTSTSTAFRVRDTTAGQDRVLGVVTWSGATPVVTMTTGTALTLNGVGYEGPLANDVYRIHVNSTTITGANNHSVEIYPASDAALSVGGTGDAYVGGVMMDQVGNTVTLYPTQSYIPTTVATVTRDLDLVQVNPFSLPIPGTIVCRARTHPVDGASDTANRRMFSASDGTNNELISAIRPGSSRVLQATITDGGAAQLDAGTTQVNANSNVAIAMAFATNNVAWSVNGGAVQTDNTATMPTVDRLLVGIVGAGNAQIWSGGIEYLAIYNQRLPNNVLPIASAYL